jgi:hypothetical protein
VPDTTSAGAFLRPEIRDEAFYGVLGSTVKELAKATDADPAGMLLQLMAQFGNAVGDQPAAYFGMAQHPGRLFVLLVGDAANGRKGTSLGAVVKLMALADPEWYETRIFRGLKSPEAMIDRVAEKKAAAGPADPRLMIVETEFARIASRMTAFGERLRVAWDEGRLEDDTAKKSNRAQAHVSLIGHITPEELSRRGDRFRHAGGLESRFLYAYVSKQEKRVSRFARPVDISGLAGRLTDTLIRARASMLTGLDPMNRELCEAERRCRAPRPACRLTSTSARTSCSTRSTRETAPSAASSSARKRTSSGSR